MLNLRVGENDQEMPQSQTTYQSMAPRGNDTEHKQPQDRSKTARRIDGKNTSATSP